VRRRLGKAFRIGTRITLTTSALVAATLAMYSLMSLRSRRADLEAQLAGQAREIATTLRVAMEQRPRDEWRGEALDLTARLASAGLPWHVELLDPPRESDDSPRAARLKRLLTLRTAVDDFARIAGRRTYVYLEPMFEQDSPVPERPRILGAIELSRDTAWVDASMRDETWRVLVSVALLVAVVIVAVLVSTRRGISRPIEKLLAGIDDVAKGDLSHVLLAEREDEIGALAARFNEMTQSLRDARGETRRGVEERLSLEARLRATSQLATIGQLAAEIAHEVGTPLNVVTGRARAMAKKSDDPVAVHKNATIIAEQAGRIVRIIQRLLDVARRKVGADERATFDLTRLAQDTLELLEYQLGSARVETRAALDRSLGAIPGDRDQVQQVLLNLCMNAIQAMPQGGTLEVRTSRVLRRRPGLEVAPEQGYAVLQVADTGVGIREEDRDKIFEAFYTSRAGSGGTGLGLAVAHGIVKDHDGWIEIDERGDGRRGTVFRIFLPETIDMQKQPGESKGEEKSDEKRDEQVSGIR
jgi:signal transduction histidine kinase